MDLNTDVVIVGGGLAGCLTALKLLVSKPDLKVLVVEESPRLGGHHTWSFHESDVTPDAMTWLKPLIEKSWDQTEVRFPRYQRDLLGRYHSMRSEHFDSYMRKALRDKALLNTTASRMSESHVELTNGDIIAARCVLDARGMDSRPSSTKNGFQKFIGADFTLHEPHGLTHPVIMDATCPQMDGFRFFYLLPWDEKRLLVEETYYSNTPELNHERIQRSLQSYIERKGWKIEKVEREEVGILPIPMTSDYIPTSIGGEALPIGVRGGYFHATTGYSTADAVRIAEFFATLPDLTTQSAREGLMKYRKAWLSRQRFYRLLNRLLFHAAEPSLRYVVMQRFYEQQPEVIDRFYSARTTWGDRVRILSGKSPVPIERAFRNLTERSVLQWSGATEGDPG